MSQEQITLGAAAVMAGLTIGTGIVRWAVTPVRPGRHRQAHLLPAEEVLCGPPTPYTDPFAETQAFGVVRTGFGECDACGGTTAGVITRNGFRCGEFARHAGGAR